MTPGQARAARAFLNLDMKTVCEQAPVGKRTLTEFERGSRAIADTTLARLKGYYLAQGIIFRSTDSSDEIIIHNQFDKINCTDDYNVRPKLEYTDLFGLSEVADEFEKLESHVSTCQASIKFSRDILYFAMSNANLNQKQIATELQCSAAFISAVLLEKKWLSADLAAAIQDKYLIDGLPEMVLAEKKIKKLLLDMQKMISSLKFEINHVKNLNSID